MNIRIVWLAACMLAVVTGGAIAADVVTAADNWPSWRGPAATGVAGAGSKPALTWGEGKNIRWKTKLPGKGHSTPIVWGDRVFVTAAIAYGDAGEPKYSGRPGAHNNLPVSQKHRFVVIAVDRKTGKTVWQTKVHEALPHEGGHESASLASASPVTDGKHVYALFGSYGLYCLDLDGKIIWQKQLGSMHSKHGHGEGSSPVLHGGMLVVNWDHEEKSFIVAIDKVTGKEKWRVARDEVTSWSTPIIVKDKSRKGNAFGAMQVIVPGTKALRGYDLETGKVVWSCSGLSANICASPVAGDVGGAGMVFVGCSYDKRAVLGIRYEGAAGDITKSDHIVWRRTRGTPYVPSLLLYGQSLYYLAHYQGVMSRVDAATGQYAPGPMRLPQIGSLYASPVGAAGRVYFTDLNGLTVVLSHSGKHGEKPEVLAVNQLDDQFSASMALAGADLFLRGSKYLYCIVAGNFD